MLKINPAPLPVILHPTGPDVAPPDPASLAGDEVKFIPNPDPPGIRDPRPFASSADSNLPFGPTKDEQLVNDALLLFLRAVNIFPSELRCEWYSARSPFDAASFGNNSMTARTDGYLEANGEVFSILEVNPPPQEAGPYCGLRHHYNYAQCQP
ncbi:hypothetical protein N7516_005777 [Penicillium verrucosum]|uniref:uncharacterized protein n=1 Tax=Penicillium verrucosum TaxID=60171 RepID=UPI002545B7B4|nr:uncharacterized protein N7516_005777 [Penicillium verrucosum]KAJ5931288.1 hypothetical protein N7516_005777 [Penicillium verrucosum]